MDFRCSYKFSENDEKIRSIDLEGTESGCRKKGWTKPVDILYVGEGIGIHREWEIRKVVGERWRVGEAEKGWQSGGMDENG